MPAKTLLPILLAIFLSTPVLRAAPLNILVLVADDLRHDSLGCAGNPVVLTPQLDRLATRGIRFTHSCVTTAICGVSRASLFTGQWMSRHGTTAFQAFQTPWAETYPGLLRQHGYHVGHVGKWHNGPFPKDQFDFGRAYSGSHWLRDPDGKPVHVTRQNEIDALEFLRSRPADKPFCLTLAFFAPHAEDGHPDQFRPQPASMALYQDITIPVPETATAAALERLPAFLANPRTESRHRWTWRFDDPDKYQRMMKNYYRLVTEVDATCGRVIDALTASGEIDRTLVIFLADNGYFHGEHGLADKWYPHEESIRVPLIVFDPRLDPAKQGSTRDHLVLNTDIAPTILAAAGIAPPARMQGSDIAPLYRSTTPPAWREEFFYEHAVIQNPAFIPASQALVRKDWKYFYWPDHDFEQLFHLAQDPLEQNDLARDPAHQKKLQELRARFHQAKAQAP